jgi:hypothetical protein
MRMPDESSLVKNMVARKMETCLQLLHHVQIVVAEERRLIKQSRQGGWIGN